MLERPAPLTSMALRSSHGNISSLFKFQLDDISLGVNECRHKQIVLLWQNNWWHKYGIGNSKWGGNSAEKAQAEPELSVQGCTGIKKMKQFKEEHEWSGTTDLSALVRFQLEYGPQHSNKSYMRREVRLVQDPEIITWKAGKNCKSSV